MLMFRPLLRYADFKGRARRAEYWLFATFQGFWYALLIGMATVAMGNSQPGQASPGVVAAFGLIVASILGLIIPNYAVVVRRLHDSGRGAIWLCLMLPSILSSLMTIGTIVTAAGAVGMGAGREAFVGTALAGFGAAGLLGLIGMIGQLALFVLTLLPGSSGPNRFGPDPRAPGARGVDPASGGGLAGYDEARLEELFAQARREQDSAEPAYRPVFDFSPGATGPMMRPLEREAETPRPAFAPASDPRPAQAWGGADWAAADAPARPFGRRGA